MWSPRLRAAIALSKALSETPSIYVLCNAHGKQVHERSLHDYWQAAKYKAAAHFEIETDFTFHDLKAKGNSDYEGTMADKQRFTGHKDMSQVNTYDRKPDIVPTIRSESISK